MHVSLDSAQASPHNVLHLVIDMHEPSTEPYLPEIKEKKPA